MQVSSELLVESKTARQQGITELSSQNSEEKVLNKVKSLLFALWDGVGRATREQLADFYEVSVSTIDSNYQRHKDEFETDGVKVFSDKELKEVRRIMRLTSSSPKETIYTPAGALRMGFILRDSVVAKAVRTTAIRFIQGVGREVGTEILLKSLAKSNSIVPQLLKENLSNLKLSAPYSDCWDKMKSTLSKQFPNGGIPGMSKDDIRKEIQFVATYTNDFKLEGIPELTYKLASETRGKYPDLTTDIFRFIVDDEVFSSIIMFEFCNLVVDVSHVENCLGRNYIGIAKQVLEIDEAYLIFVAPFGATSYAEDYIQRCLLSEHQGRVGVLTVRDLANYIYNRALSTRKLGTAKGEINSEFKKLLNYSFPDKPTIWEQPSLF